MLQNVYLGNTLESWLLSIGLIVLAYLLGKTAYWILGNVVKVITRRTKTKLDDIIVDMIEEPIMFAIILSVSWFAVGMLTFSEGLTTWVNNIFAVLVVLNITWLVSRLFEALFHEYLVPLAEKTETDLDDMLLPVGRTAIKIAIWSIGIIIALDNAGYNVGALLAGLGIGGLALAMAAKDTVANFFGGVTVFADKPFAVKDRIKIGGFDGIVEEIGLRSTRLKTFAGTEIVMPNKVFTEEILENISREPSRRIVTNLGLTYDTTPAKMRKAQKILADIVKKNKLVTDKSLISFNQWGDFNLGITFIYYIKKGSDVLEAQNEINLAVLEQFNKNKINFAFPTQTIYHKKF